MQIHVLTAHSMNLQAMRHSGVVYYSIQGILLFSRVSSTQVLQAYCCFHSTVDFRFLHFRTSSPIATYIIRTAFLAPKP
ncbi:hypothetical protein H671_3g11153 [Cricetulus griseus]|uniref:Uncharacterized protein n=1 Tax=Cricetulus griseus TaxID=10029 RepID=A0A061I674_CRIGR|nr:hypothetical protein H671_3g11153 [Cricetulus griseus]